MQGIAGWTFVALLSLCLFTLGFTMLYKAFRYENRLDPEALVMAWVGGFGLLATYFSF